ncbi:MAG: spondin domain-containing protein [Chloroflexales bacterium]|nr:spondin domain-containing protein [Chloroflexales bacterium]
MNSKRMSRYIAPLVALLLLATGGVSFAAPRHGANLPTATYEVTIYNLTGGQPFSPPVLATHSRAVDVFTVGAQASEGIKEIAENGNNAVLVPALNSNPRVLEVVEGNAPLVPAANPGGTPFSNSTTLTIHANLQARFLSAAFMLICTNDGFSGVDAVRLPPFVGSSSVIYSNGYDAGTEVNTEDFADIVPPCQGLIGVTSDDSGAGMSNPALAEGGNIVHHPGVAGGNDLLSELHGWDDPVAKIVITRVN